MSLAALSDHTLEVDVRAATLEQARIESTRRLSASFSGFI